MVTTKSSFPWVEDALAPRPSLSLSLCALCKWGQKILSITLVEKIFMTACTSKTEIVFMQIFLVLKNTSDCHWINDNVKLMKATERGYVSHTHIPRHFRFLTTEMLSDFQGLCISSAKVQGRFKPITFPHQKAEPLEVCLMLSCFFPKLQERTADREGVIPHSIRYT